MSEFQIEVLGKKAPRPRRRKPQVSGRIAALIKGRLGVVRTLAAVIWWLVKPRRPTWLIGGLAAVIVTFGTPHLLVTYNCTGVGSAGYRCTACRYVGVQGMRNHLGFNWDCPAVAMLPVNWRGLQRQLGL